MGRLPGRRKMIRRGEKDKLYRKNMIKSGRNIYTHNEKTSTYLKYLRVVRKYIQEKYELSLNELELVLFLYDEDIFSRDTFVGYSCILGFNSIDWMSKFKKRGIIKIWRDEPGYKHLFVLTQKYKIACRKMYNHLEGTPIPTRTDYNPMFAKKDPTQREKMYQKLVRKMNEKRQQDEIKKRGDDV